MTVTSSWGGCVCSACAATMASSIPGLGKVPRRPPFQGRPEKPLTNPGTKVVPRDGHREVEQGFCYIVGGVLSPILAKVYLHHVLDDWVEMEVKPRLRGEMYLIRFADDFIACFQY